MSQGTELAAFLVDQLRPMGRITTKRMFSGEGVWCDGLMFALIIDDIIYFKADDGNRLAFEAEGMTPFTYQGKSRRISVGYWRLPERLLDEPDDLGYWARQALAAARRAAAKKARSGQARKAPAKPVKANR